MEVQRFEFARPKHLVFKCPAGLRPVFHILEEAPAARGPVTFSVPYYGFVAKIIDFGFSSIPEMGIQSSIAHDPTIGIVRNQNDLLFLFHDLHNLAGNNRKILQLLEQLEPTRAYTHLNKTHIQENAAAIATYADMVFSDVFAEYRAATPVAAWHTYN
jgi:hypothetical protein